MRYGTITNEGMRAAERRMSRGAYRAHLMKYAGKWSVRVTCVDYSGDTAFRRGFASVEDAEAWAREQFDALC